MSLEKFKEINFAKIAKRFETYNPLSKLVNTMNIITLDDVTPYFSKDMAKQLIWLQGAYSELNKQRNCGNPFFIHLLRAKILAQSLGFSNKVQLLSMYHDFFEDFAINFQVTVNLLKEIPEELVEPLHALTNNYTPLARQLDAISTNHSASAIKKLVLLKYGRIPTLRRVVGRIIEELTLLPDALDGIKHLERRSYALYIKDLVEFVEQENSYETLTAKFIDRLDNTLSDYVQDLKKFKKLYRKNIILFNASSELIKKSKNNKLKVLYVILLERSLGQVRATIKEYSSLQKERGTFYGNQYIHSSEDLSILEQELKSFEEFAEEFLSLPPVQKIITNLYKTD